MNTNPNTIRYYYYSEEGLKNGSFARRSKYGLGLFTLGDFMGMIENVPEGWTPFDLATAQALIPQSCR